MEYKELLTKLEEQLISDKDSSNYSNTNLSQNNFGESSQERISEMMNLFGLEIQRQGGI